MDPCGVPAGNCFAIEDWSDPTASAAKYESLIKSSPQVTKDKAGAPSFDLILLGESF